MTTMSCTGDSTLTAAFGSADLAGARNAEALFTAAKGALEARRDPAPDEPSLHDQARPIFEMCASEAAHAGRGSAAESAIGALARAVDAKDPSTGEHCDRVSLLAGRIAETLGWTPARVKLMEEAALVHDVGKLGVPDAVLAKPGPLDDDEYEQIKRHTVRGAEIVSGVLLPEQVGWVRWHHERPDGHGYPDCLDESRIPLGAGILAVADVFDVMTSHRSYSRVKPLPEVLAECRSLVGRQFLSEPVDALIRLFSKAASPSEPAQLAFLSARGPGQAVTAPLPRRPGHADFGHGAAGWRSAPGTATRRLTLG